MEYKYTLSIAAVDQWCSHTGALVLPSVSVAPPSGFYL